jgi:hypothetical protein
MHPAYYVAAWMAHVLDMITNPAKLIEFPAQIAKLSIDFAQSILKLVV